VLRSREFGLYGDRWTQGRARLFLWSMSTQLPKKIETYITPVLERMGLTLVLGTFHRERGGRVLRLLIERQDAAPETGSGVDVNLCATVSREVSTALDVADAVEEHYTLEVSSPGIERPLVHESDFERFSGRLVKIKTKKPLDGMRTFEGVLNGIEKESVSLTSTRNREILIPNGMIQKAHLVFDDKR
jgi:ribosome maturation factor RimP